MCGEEPYRGGDGGSLSSRPAALEPAQVADVVLEGEHGADDVIGDEPGGLAGPWGRGDERPIVPTLGPRGNFSGVCSLIHSQYGIVTFGVRGGSADWSSFSQ
ncbi:hypothetical protein GCM10018779_58460 [Streptomyces griseocarneus]|nr:hypothetical protein GCM10018779_58460 [Streptomyces griseocarneus]